MTVWASPWAFALLLPVLAAVAWIWYARRRRTATLQFSHIAGFLKSHRGYRAQLSWLPTVVKVVALALAVVALARPQKADTKVKRNVEGIDIVIVFDISDSMLIEDMEPENRMESAKQTMANFIKGRVSDRIGLVVFAGESYTRVPLTLDYPLLLRNLAEVEPARNIKMGTAIGVGLANGVARMKDSTAKSRVVILMTDGENNSGTIDPDTAIEIARGYGIKVYSIGMGRDGDAQLPVVVEDVFGRKVKRYRPIHSSVNDALLTKMAETTGGKYWRAITGNALREAFAEIDRLEKTKIETSQFTRYAEMFPPYLRWAVLLYVLAVFLGTTVLRKGP
ncbi:MAG: VWA domain-containing protein [Bdellovibrionales bacterium]|nr:VWA domain-containing protein [Bdellovibrionales bacterium]